MFSVNAMPWWTGTSWDEGQATILGEHPTWEEARKLAGLDWDPVEDELARSFSGDDMLAMRDKFARVLLSAELDTSQMLDRLTVAAAISQRQVEGWKHIGRSDEPGATLACTQLSYKVIANSAFGEIFTALLEQPNVKYETGGCLDGGRQVWMLVLLDEPIVLNGDPSTATYPYMSLMSRHDARGSTALRTTQVRIVCGNTFDMAEAEGERSGLTYSFIHRGNWRDHLDDARQAVTGVRAQARQYKELSERLLLVPVSKDQERLFVATFFPVPPAGEASDRVLGNVEKSRDKLRQILAGDTVAGAGIGGTAYGLLQGAVEYLDHARAYRSWETKLGRTLLKPEPLKTRALSILGEVCDMDLKADLKAAKAVSDSGLLVAWYPLAGRIAYPDEAQAGRYATVSDAYQWRGPGSTPGLPACTPTCHETR